jgi:hypothetical protein
VTEIETATCLCTGFARVWNSRLSDALEEEEEEEEA